MSKVEKIIESLMRANVQVNCELCKEPIELGHTFDCIVNIVSPTKAKFYHKKCFKKEVI